MPNRICHFEIGCRDYARAKDFYSKVFDWRFEKGGGGDEVIRTGADVGVGLRVRQRWVDQLGLEAVAGLSDGLFRCHER